MHLPSAGDSGAMEHHGAAARYAAALLILRPDHPDAQLDEAGGLGPGMVPAARLHAQIPQLTQFFHEFPAVDALVSRGF